MFSAYITTLLEILNNLNKYYIFSQKYFGEYCVNIKSIICEIESLKGEIEKLDDGTDTEQLNYFECIKNYVNDLLLGINYNQIVSNNRLSYFIYPPENLTFTINPNSTITLNWDIITNSETGYLVQRSFDLENWSSIGTLEANISSFTDELNNLGNINISELDFIYYRVFSVRNGKCSTSSMILEIEVDIAPPINLSVQLTGIDDTTLTWTNVSVFPINYIIQRSTTPGSNFSTIATVSSLQTSYEDLNLVSDTTYYYRICLEGNTNDCISEVSVFVPIPFISTWDTNNTSSGSSTSTQVTLPLLSNGSYNFIVDWGDGVVETITQWDQTEVTHTYSIAQIYEIQIAGILRGFAFGDLGDKLKILDISSFGIFQPIGPSVFFGCNNLDISATDPLDLSQTSTLESFFQDCLSLSSPDFNNWDVSGINTLASTFNNCSSFTGNVSNWVTTNVTTLSRTFFGCSSFNGDISNWNVINVTVMSTTFQGASVFNSDISSWDVDNVQFLNACFFACSAFNADISGWNVANVTNLAATFFGCAAFNRNLNSWDVSNVTDMSSCFNLCTSFNQPLNNWDVSNVENMSAMFRQCSVFNQPLNNWNVGNVTNMDSMFRQATSFNRDISGWDVTNVTNLTRTFNGTTLFNQPIGNWTTTSLQLMGSIFENASNFNQPLNSWDVSNVTFMNSAFNGASSFNQPLNLWNTSNLINASSCFQATLFNQNISNWLIPNVNNLSNMFNVNFTFSTANLDALLNSFAAQAPSIQNNVVFDAPNTMRSAASDAAVTLLTITYGWTINTL